MRPWFSLAWLIVIAGAALARGQEPDDGRSRTETLEAILKSVIEDTSASPAVLADFDPRRADASSVKAARALKATKVDFELTQQPLEDVLGLFAKVTGVPFTLTAKAREAATKGKVQVTFAITGLALENVLNLLMLQLGDYRFAVRYGAVVCMLKEEYKPKAVLVLYNVSDLIRPRPDFAAPKLGLSGKDESK